MKDKQTKIHDDDPFGYNLSNVSPKTVTEVIALGSTLGIH
jgi:hypothetical protein